MVSNGGVVHADAVVVVVVVVDLCILGSALPSSHCCYWTDLHR